MSASDPTVWTGRALQAESDDLEVIGLALLYPALERNVCVPGHDGYPRASDLIRRDRSSISSFQLADLGGKADNILGVSLSHTLGEPERVQFRWLPS
jgi:hypothetical protein